MRTPRRSWISVGCIACLLAPAVWADVSLPKVLGDHMVLQRDRPVPIWGRAEGGEKVTVEFAGQMIAATAGADGRWRVKLAPLAASAEARELRIVGKNTIALRDILVGEVWLCSGQSNMEYPASRPVWGKANGIEPELPPGPNKPVPPPDPVTLRELAQVDLPELRLFRVEKKLQPNDVASPGWQLARGEALTLFTAIGFYFGRDLQRELHVPIGVIQSAWGGSRIEKFIPADAFAGLPAFEKETALPPPLVIDGYRNPGNFYRAIVAPLAPFAVRGVLWYQGESNIIAGNDGVRYADKLLALVRGWRKAWEQPELPFYTVQLAPFTYTTRRDDPVPHTAEELPRFWEAQFLTQMIPHVELIPSMDQVDDLTSIHPRFKEVLAARLAAQALAKTYGRTNLVSAGPTFDRAEFRDSTALVHFHGVGEGLASRDGKPLTDFELAGADGHFFPAQATIDHDVVRLTAADVPVPKAVRFAWNETAQPNLMNRAKWPAYPFRSDGATWQPAVVR